MLKENKNWLKIEKYENLIEFRDFLFDAYFYEESKKEKNNRKPKHAD
ncbi:MAG: hypothetical protein GF317_23720 [Candidatus Lokiarchaeota archaeon]|nr:hypothetical protein [Candidatus Lokiarchaeota archaeon]MBD3202379.1 hypothetical protein [Candidatus Lokiarchaeota archaeon]